MKIDLFKIEEWMNKYEKLAKYDFTTTCIKPFSLREFFEFTGVRIDEIMDTPLDYGCITGSERLKNNVAKLYDNKNGDNVSVTLGAIGANSLVFKSLLEKGDEVVSVIPTYQQHYSVPKQFGCKVKFVKLKPQLNWHIDIDELDRTVSPKTKLITINNPNNPTGALLTEKEIKKITEIAKKNNSYILSDEVYRFINHNRQSSSVSFVDLYDKAISTFSMSKAFSLAGIRVGFVVSEKSITDKINLQRQYDTISISAFDDFVASIAIENMEKIIQRNLQLVLKGKKILTDWIANEEKIGLIEPQAGTTAFISYSDKRNSYDFCLDLFNDTGVLLLPGETMDYENHCRLGYCCETTNLQEGLNIFSEWLKKTNIH